MKKSNAIALFGIERSIALYNFFTLRRAIALFASKGRSPVTTFSLLGGRSHFLTYYNSRSPFTPFSQSRDLALFALKGRDPFTT
ncbi:hypothetical protein [Microcoleus sp. A003_D6]|uniref:hypothetical protein n=1 Tax=Microcoleus sp. A003_D6 TaxID=3055266 RepID=UPI002FD505F5